MRQHTYSLILYFGIYFMCNLVYFTYLPIYLDELGLNKTNIGIIFSIAPVAAILGQAFWGRVGDRVKYRNTVLLWLLGGTGVLILMFPLSRGLLYMIVINVLFTFFQASMNPASDVVALEYAQRAQVRYGIVRLFGTVGYALMALIAGKLLSGNVRFMFLLYFIINAAAMLCLPFLPKIQRPREAKKSLPFRSLFRYGKLMVYLAYTLVIYITLAFYGTFYSIYFTKIGGTGTQLGWSYFVACLGEIPFLYFFSRITARFKTEQLLLVAGCAAALRWLLIGVTTNVTALIFMQLLHGMIYIVMMVPVATYISQTVPEGLKAQGQALNAICAAGISKVVGSLLGGWLSDHMQMRTVFLLDGFIALAAVLGFSTVLLWWRHAERRAQG